MWNHIIIFSFRLTVAYYIHFTQSCFFFNLIYSSVLIQWQYIDGFLAVFFKLVYF